MSFFLSTLYVRSAILFKIPEDYCIGVVSYVLNSTFALDEHCTKVVSYVHGVVCPGVRATMVHSFLQICEISTHWHWQGENDLYIYICCCLFKNLEQF